MGKKSLFQPTTAPEEEKKAPEPEKVSDAEKIKATETPAPEPKSAPVETPVAETASAASDEPAPEKAVPPSAEHATPPPQATPLPEVADPSPARETPPCINTFEPPDLKDPAPFESDPLIDAKSLKTIAVVVCGIILLIFLGSMMNADNYYVKQSRGAVEIWKGDFTPGGKDRIVVLPGAHWKQPARTSYSKEDVFPFVAAYYLEKARMLTEAPVSEDFDHINYYLDLVQKLYAEDPVEEVDSTISLIRKTIAEARILQVSGEKAAVDLAQKKIQTIDEALTDLVAFFAGGDEPEAAAVSGH